MASLRVYLCIGVLVCMFMTATAKRRMNSENQRFSLPDAIENRLEWLEQRRESGRISEGVYNKLASPLKMMQKQQMRRQR